MDEREIIRYQAKGVEVLRDPLVEEARVSIWVNGAEAASLMALPAELEELALGFLYCECYFDDPATVREVTVNPRLHAVSVTLAGPARMETPDAVRTFTTGCGRSVSRVSPLWSACFPVLHTAATHPVAEILAAVGRLVGSSPLFRDTGCVHTAGLWQAGDFRRICDDIGRHNAADKVIGHALRNRWPVGDDAMLVSTGRLSSDIVMKTIRAGIPLLVSRSAPTSGAVQIAEAHGVTLVGFARAERCNVYTHPNRVRPS